MGSSCSVRSPDFCPRYNFRRIPRKSMVLKRVGTRWWSGIGVLFSPLHIRPFQLQDPRLLESSRLLSHLHSSVLLLTPEVTCDHTTCHSKEIGGEDGRRRVESESSIPNPFLMRGSSLMRDLFDWSGSLVKTSLTVYS